MHAERLRILVVEDNPADVDLLRALLAEVPSAHFSLTVVERLDSALAELGQNRFDAVLLDLHLPDSHGMETFHSVHEHSPETPIIVVTALDLEETGTEAVRSGAQDFLVKDLLTGWLVVKSVHYAIERMASHLALEKARNQLEDRVAEQVRDIALNERRYRAMVENMSSGMAVYEAVDDGKDFIFLDFNASAERIESIRRRNLIGKRITEVFPGVQEFGLIQVLREVWRSGRSRFLPAKFYKDERINGWRENFVYKLPTGEIVSIYDDVTDRIKAEEQMALLARFPRENPSPIIRLDQEGHILYRNEAANNLLSFCSPSEVNLKEDVFTRKVLELAAEQSRTPFDFQCGPRILSFSVTAIPEAGYINVYGMDVTKRREAEAKLRKSEQRYRELYDSMRDGFVIMNMDGHIIECNPAFMRLLNMDQDELTRMTMADITHPDWHEEDSKILRDEVMPMGYSNLHDKILFRSDGEEIIASLRIHLLRDDAGTPMGMWAIVRDVTERRRAEDELRKLNRVVEQSPVSVVITDPDGRIEYVNPKFCETTGYTVDEAIGQNPRILKSGVQSDEFYGEMWATLIAGKVWHGELVNKHKDGAMIWEQVTISPIRDVQNQITHYAAVKEDISLRKAAEEELRRKTQVEALFSTISSSFINLAPEDAEERINMALKLFASLFQADRICILTSEKGGLCREYLWSDDKSDGAELHHQCLPRRVVPWLMKRLETLQDIQIPDTGDMPDEARHDQSLLLHEHVRSFYAVPICIGKRPLGLLAVSYIQTPVTWQPDDAILLETVANLIAQALESIHSKQEIHKNLAINEALARLYAPLVSPSSSIAAISEVILEETMSLIGCGQGYVGTIDPANGDLVGHTMSGMLGKECQACKPNDSLRFSPDKKGKYPQLWGEALNTKAPMFTNDPATHPASKGLPDGHIHISSFLSLPVLLGNELVGQIALANKPVGFEEEDLQLMVPIARYYALAIQRMRTIAKLEESEERFRSLVESMNEGVAIIDEESRFTYVNHRLCRMLGYPRDVILEGRPEQFMDEPNNEIMRINSEKCRQGFSDKFELTWCGKEDNRIFTLVSPTPIFSEQGQFKGSFVVITDITELKLLESQLLQAQKLESIGSLAAGIAHEINTPSQYVANNTRYLERGFEDTMAVMAVYQELKRALTAGEDVSSILQQLNDIEKEKDVEFLREEIPAAIQDALDGMERISTIVKSVKQFAHPGQEDKELANLNDAVTNTVTVSTNEWKYVATVETDLEENLPLVPCVTSEINQVLLNLIVNAAQAIGERVKAGDMSKGVISICTRSVDNGVEISVADQGGGIPAAIQNQVFNPFFTTKPPGEGTGQGLAIAHTIIVEKHGGNIGFESVEGDGTTFTITLPIEMDEEQGTP